MSDLQWRCNSHGRWVLAFDQLRGGLFEGVDRLAREERDWLETRATSRRDNHDPGDEQ